MDSFPVELIKVSAIVVRDERGAILTVRKRGTHRFMLPGGKPEPGESPAETAVRELVEEVGIVVTVGDLTELGTFRAAAANEAGHEVEGVTFLAPMTSRPVCSAEIAELRWLDPGGPLPDDLAPLLEVRILPVLVVNSVATPTGPQPRTLG